MKFRFPESRSIYPVMWEKVETLLKEISTAELYRPPIQKKFLNAEARRAAEHFTTWVEDIISLREYPYAYPICGVTEAINNWLLTETRPVQVFRGEYAWPGIVCPEIEKIDHPENISADKVLYFSNPHSLNGNFDPRWEQILKKAPAVVLDCAFVGSTAKKKIPVGENVEQIFFSFSKGAGLSRLRAGWKFSRKPDALYEQLTGLSYYHGLIPAVSALVTQNFAVDYFHQFLAQAQQQLCRELNLKPSDSYLLGYGDQGLYPHFLREDGKTERLCLTEFYYQMDLPCLAQSQAFVK